MPSPRSLSVAVLSLAALILPALVAATIPSYSAPCGDTRVGYCPGEPFVGSSFTGVMCSYIIGETTGAAAQSDGLTIEACAAACATQPIMVYRPSALTCTCYDDIISANTADCVDERLQVYYHGPGPQASGYSKRQQLARTRRAAEEDASLCRTGWTACRIDGSDDGYECIDTLTELESCGGCLHGAFAPTSTARRTLRRVNMAPLILSLGPSNAARLSIGFDCSDRSQFGPGLTCRGGACVPA